MNFCSILCRSVSSTFSLLCVFRRLWLLRTFLGKTGLVVRWLVLKQPFLPFLTHPGSTIWSQKAQIRNSLKSILVRKNRKYIIINFVTLRLTKTKVKLLKIISFLPSLTQIRQKFGPNHPSNVAFPAIFALNFHSSVCKTTNFCYKRYSPCEIWKKLIDNACFFTFFHDFTNRLNLEMEPKYLTKSDIQLNPNILRTKNHKRVLLKALE